MPFYHRRIVFVGLITCTLVVVLVTGCDQEKRYPPNPHIKDIILAEQVPGFWYLSPSGDKLLYNNAESGNYQTTVQILSTGQELTIDECSKFRWLDDQTIYCFFYENEQPASIITIEDQVSSNVFSKTIVKEVTAEQVALDALLKQAQAIYRLHPSNEDDTLLVLSTDKDDSAKYITNIENWRQVFETYTYTIVSLQSGGLTRDIVEKMYSPNEKYYYLIQDNTFRVFDTANGELLIEFKTPLEDEYQTYFQIGGNWSTPNQSKGWASDSSGVYFQISISGGGLGPPTPIQPIQKLCVPE